MRSLYSTLLYLLLPFILLRMLWRSRRAPAYRRRLGERLGRFSVPASVSGRPVIWVHAVSLGETLAAAPVIEHLLESRPDHALVVTTTTPTGSERVRALFADRVFHVYAPWDTPGAVNRFLERIRPRLLLLMETELWPNLLAACEQRGCRVVLANARLSEKSARGYRRFGKLTHEMLQRLSAVAAQTQADGERFVDLGLPRERLTVTGSIKFDIALDRERAGQADRLCADWAKSERFIVVAASTHPGEDGPILEAFAALRRQVPSALLLLVPRHPERFDAVFAQSEAAGFRVLRRSSGTSPSRTHEVVIGDTVGELSLLLCLADVAIIGGSLVPHGGHNALEAAVWGAPILCGPHMFNFAEITRLLAQAGALRQLESAEALGPALLELATAPGVLGEMGAAGRAVVRANRGAREQLQALIDREISAAG